MGPAFARQAGAYSRRLAPMTLHLPQLPHIGQVRAAVCLDVMIRWLLASVAQPSRTQLSAGLAGFGLVSPVVPLAKALGVVRPQELRYYLLAEAHYSQAIGYTDRAAEDAATRYQRIERFVARATGMFVPEQAGADAPGSRPPAKGPIPSGRLEPASPANLPFSFVAAMNDNLSVPEALASVHATVHDGNYAISLGDRDAAATSLVQVRSMLGVLGLDPLNPYWAAAGTGDRLDSADPRDRVIDALVRLALRQRDAARGRGDYASADSISGTLEGTGIEVVDTSAGPQWELRR
jgi:cysteinyl-tRNA synthetase